MENDGRYLQPFVSSGLPQEYIRAYETELELRDRSHWVNVTHIPDLDGEGGVKGFISLISDISDRKATERMKDEFVSVVSHELRTSLTSVSIAVRLD